VNLDVVKAAEGQVWDAELQCLPRPHILQSWAWGETKAQTGWRAQRLLWHEGARPAAAAAVLTRPEAHLELVRPGVSVYGLSPVPDLGGPEAFGLRPAMTLTARAALVKRVPAGSGVSYSHRYTTTRETSLLLVPLGYADGIPRAASSRGPVLAAGAVRQVAGRVCMDQFVLDIGDDAAAAGDPVVLFGPGDAGEPTAQDWADAADTIHYEITTRLGVRVPRVYVGTAGRALGDGGGAAAEGGR
jgi:alanine racemase